MKKLLFILLILLLGAAAILYFGYAESRSGAKPEIGAFVSQNTGNGDTAVASADEKPETAGAAAESAEAASVEQAETDIWSMLDQLADALPELDKLQKEILLPQITQWVEEGKALPDWLVTQLEERGLTLDRLPGDSYADKLNRFIRENRDKVLVWLQSLREE